MCVECVEHGLHAIALQRLPCLDQQAEGTEEDVGPGGDLEALGGTLATPRGPGLQGLEQLERGEEGLGEGKGQGREGEERGGYVGCVWLP